MGDITILLAESDKSQNQDYANGNEDTTNIRKGQCRQDERDKPRYKKASKVNN